MPLDMRMPMPGLVWRHRDGKSVAYWQCRSDMVKKGYPVKNHRLWSGPEGTRPTADEMTVIQRECFRLQGEMRDWSKRPDQRKSPKWRRNGVIYFVRSGDCVKIGFASNLGTRLSQLRISTPTPLELLGTIPGNRYVEQFLHWQFRRSREKGEWFKLTDNLRAFIAENVEATTFERASGGLECHHVRSRGYEQISSR